MPDTVIPTSPVAGAAPSPAAPSEPTGAGAPAPSAQQPATSGSSPTPGTVAATTSASPADAAFDSYLAESVAAAPDNPQPTPAPAPPAAEPQQPEPQPPTEPTADPSDGPELEAALTPTPEDQQKGFVPVKNLSRALKSRREAITRADQLEARLTQESQIIDKVIGTFNAAGVDAQNLPTFLANLGRARNDPQAQAAILAQLGIQIPQPTQQAAPQPTPPVEAAALIQKLEAYDVDGALSLLRGQVPQPPAQQPQQSTPPTPVQAPPAQPQAPPPQPTPAPDPGKVALLAQVQAMSQTLQVTYGPQEAVRLSKEIDAAAHARVTELREKYRVPVSSETIARVYQDVHREVLQSEQQRRSKPSVSSQPIRPAPVPTQHRIPTADEQFEAEFGRR